MTDALKRAIRTFLQGFVATLALIAIPLGQNLIQTVAGGGNLKIDVNLWGAVGVAAVVGGGIALVTWAQNALEDRTGKAILK
jgi:hypothetical protein